MKSSFYIILLLSIIIISCKDDETTPSSGGNEIPTKTDTSEINTDTSETVDSTKIVMINTSLIHVDSTLNLNDSLSILNFIRKNEWDTSIAPDNSQKRFILLEEFVGHKSLFSPAGTREVMRLESIYKEQLIPVAIHAGIFSTPKDTGTKYTTDFRVDGNHGESYLNKFNSSMIFPSAIISRKNTAVSNSSEWEKDIDAIKNDIPSVQLKLENYTAKNSDVLRTRIEIEWLNTLTEQHNLQVYLIEDLILDWQLEGTSDVPDYEHRNTLRKVVNNTYGKKLDSAITGRTEQVEYLFPFNNNWKRENLKVVAFIFKKDPSFNTNEVLQVNEAKVE